MKKLFFIFLLLCSICTKAQEMPSVASVTFGWSYEKCKEILDKKYNGGENSLQFEANKLTYYNVTFGNEHFDYVEFYFQSDAKNTYLYIIMFTTSFNDTEYVLLKAKKDRLYNMYNQKYGLRWEGTNDDGCNYYTFGHNPINDENGFVLMNEFKGTNNAGDQRLWLSIGYGPVNFVNPEDEI
ncbi:MAG: hypothetical protein LUC88_02845 [Prevotella sp.]|nr:hypothetical protein [Prevotella sp.]